MKCVKIVDNLSLIVYNLYNQLGGIIMSKKLTEKKIRFTQKNSYNYAHMITKKDLFHDTFMYVDTQDRYIEKLLESNDIVCEIGEEFINPNNPYRIFFLRCRKRDANILRERVFPKLHHKIAHKLGNNYLNFCEFLFDALTNEDKE